MSEFLKGKTAVITGGSRGLGNAMALALAARDETAWPMSLYSSKPPARRPPGSRPMWPTKLPPVHEFTLEEWRRVNDTNVTSVFRLCRAFVPHMKGKGYGRIVDMTSIMSHISLPGRTAYSTSKAALLGFTRALALELVTDGVTVVGISPGLFATEMNLPS